MSFRFIFLTFLLLGIYGAQAYENTPFPIVIDPGHGGEDSGIVRSGLVEKDLTLAVAKKIFALAANRKEIAVTLTRNDDHSVSFDDRRKIGNRAIGGVFISLHFSLIPDPDRTGTRIFTLAPPPPAKPKFILPLERAHVSSSYRSKELATSFLDMFQADTIQATMETIDWPLAPLLGIEIPAILIELENLGAQAALYWKESESVDAEANRIINAIDRFRLEGKNPPP